MNVTLSAIATVASMPERMRELYPDHVLEEDGLNWYVLAYDNSGDAFAVARSAGDAQLITAVWDNKDFGGYVVAVYCTDEQISELSQGGKHTEMNLGVERVVEQHTNELIAAWNWNRE